MLVYVMPMRTVPKLAVLTYVAAQMDTLEMEQQLEQAVQVGNSWALVMIVRGILPAGTMCRVAAVA